MLLPVTREQIFMSCSGSLVPHSKLRWCTKTTDSRTRRARAWWSGSPTGCGGCTCSTCSPRACTCWSPGSAGCSARCSSACSPCSSTRSTPSCRRFSPDHTVHFSRFHCKLVYFYVMCLNLFVLFLHE